MTTSAVIHFWEDQKDEHPLGLYLHADGDTIAPDLADALKATRDRWDDPEYATRMVVQHILEARDIGAEDTGSGLFVGTEDRGQGNRTLNVNWGSKVVWTHDQRIPFEQYINGEWKAVSND